MMNNINLIYIVPLLLTVIVVIYSIIKGKNTPKNSLTRNLILVIVLSIIASTLIIDKYYENQLEIEKEKLNSLLTTSQLSDSLLQNSISRQQKLDSLEKQNQELLEILANIKNKEKILGQQDKIKSDINNKIKTNKIEIGVIEKYNQILDKNSIEKWKGRTSSGITSNFIFDCPTDFESDYLDLKLQFQDETLISKIQYIYISFTEKNSENRYTLIFDQIYQPQNGVNGFKVKNYFKMKKKVDLEIGYILKSETNKDYPRFERVICRNY
ncbi:hypothetical protein PG326_00040 [Riemerella anatipestifer]|nr:hypothetical protein [Riemerella anatipestifer]MDY3356726.1 hypothetical protein [Riemerella anatipestifer]